MPGEAEISDMLWFTSLNQKANILIASSSSESDPAIVVLKYDDKNKVNIIGKASP
jgi:hypothetical protein